MMLINAYFVATCPDSTSSLEDDPRAFTVESGPYFSDYDAKEAAKNSTKPLDSWDKRVVISGTLELRNWGLEHQ